MKKEENYLIQLNPRWFNDLSFTEAIIYSIIKDECEKNNGLCKLGNPHIARIISRGDLQVSLSITELINKGYVERDLRVRNRRIIKLSNK